MQSVLKFPNNMILNQRCFYKQKTVAAKVLSERIKALNEKVYEVSCIYIETCQESHSILRSLVRT